MRDGKIFGGIWECFGGVKDMGEPLNSPIIICRPQINVDKDGAYFIFHKDKVIIERADKIEIVGDEVRKILVRK